MTLGRRHATSTDHKSTGKEPQAALVTLHWFVARRNHGGIVAQQETPTAKNILDRNITAVNARDIEAYLANQRPDVEFVLPGGVTLRGPDQVKQYTEALWEAFPDGALTFGAQVFGEDMAATEVVFTGTHTGPMVTPNGSVPPTGKAVVLHSASILRIKDGRIASEHVYVDQLEMMTQLGLA
jgi:predicted ester cyclase